MKMEPIGCPETSEHIYQYVQHNIPEERRHILLVVRFNNGYYHRNTKKATKETPKVFGGNGYTLHS